MNYISCNINLVIVYQYYKLCKIYHEWKASISQIKGDVNGAEDRVVWRVRVEY